MPSQELYGYISRFKHQKRLRWKDKTKATYDSILSLFAQFAEEEPWPPSVDLIIDWLELVSRSNSPATVHSYWAHLRAFLNFCERIEAIPAADNPARLLVDLEMSPKNPQLSPVAYTDDEVARLLDYLTDRAKGEHKRDQRAIRDRAIILFAYVTGARANEIAKLQKRDIDFERKQALIRRKTSKSSKDHWVALDDETVTALLAYWKTRPRQAAGVREFFVSYGGRSGLGKPISAHALNLMLRRRCRDAGMEHRKFHALRHSSALAALDAGLPIHYVRDQLGHRSLESTQVYTRARNKEQLDAYKRAGLGSRVSGKKRSDDKPNL
jgi:integrase